MASSTNPSASAALTTKQKKDLINRFEREKSRREEKLRASSKLLAKEVEARVRSRLNKVLRKLWDVKIKDVISIERETQNLEVMKLLYHINRMKKQGGK